MISSERQLINIEQKDLKKDLIIYFKSIGLEVFTNTKARGHQGFFLKNRIDISKNTKEERIVPTLLHEFVHYIHEKLENDIAKTGGNLEKLFNLDEMSLRAREASAAIQEKEPFGLLRQSFFIPRNDKDISTIEKELLQVTNFVDENSLCQRLKTHKEQVKKKIKAYESIIKEDYPQFMRSKKFKEFDRYIKKSKAKYLLKYDRVKLVSPGLFRLLKQVEVFSLDSLERDFPDMPAAFCAYLRLKSAQKKQSRISAKINKLNKYYSRPTELFARFVEGLYIDEARVRALAPLSTQRFFDLLERGYYFELKDVFKLLQKNVFPTIL